MTNIRMTGRVVKAYNPKSQPGGMSPTFFFELLDKDGKRWKGMAHNAHLEAIRFNALVEIEGTKKNGWLTPNRVHVWQQPTFEVQEITLDIGYVGSPRATHYGLGMSTRLANGEWITIPCRVALRHFEGDGAEADRKREYSFPRGGQGMMKARLFVNGPDKIVGEILDWSPMTKSIKVSVLFKDVAWGTDTISFRVNGGRLSVSTGLLPFDVSEHILGKLPGLSGALTFRGTAIAHSMAPHKVGWTWQRDEFEVSVDTTLLTEIQTLIESDKVSRALSAVRKALKDLWSQGRVVDQAMINEMFLAQGVTPSDELAREVLEDGRGYDARFLKALRDLAGEGAPVWAASEGFIVQIGEWLVWEVPIHGNATYIVPATPNPEIAGGEELDVAEWASVLGRILPDSKRMDLRYGEIGQALAGCQEGIQFAFHVLDDDGEFPGWLEAVRLATAGEPTPLTETAGLPSLADILLLTGGGEDGDNGN